jgi:acetylserotonin N-methyltransferase
MNLASLPCENPLVDLWLGGYRYAATTVADELQWFARLEGGPLTYSELANALEVDPKGLLELGNVLVGLGFLEKDLVAQTFSLTPFTRTYLLPSSPAYRGPTFFRARKSKEHERMRDALRSSRTAMVTANGKTQQEMWSRGEVSVESAREFAPAMHAGGFAAAHAAAESGLFDSVHRLLDIGGGSGSFGIALAGRGPAPQTTLFDLAPVCEVALEYLERFGARNRVTPVSGNFWQTPWPTGHDGILFSNILHDWTLAQCRDLAKRAFDAVEPGGRVFVHEMLLDEGKRGPLTTLCFSLAMYISHGSQQFTASEIEMILSDAGFESITVTPTFGYYSVVTGVRPR